MLNGSNPFTFSAALLAGGKSTRMGRDKALLECSGQLLWQRQLEVLRQLRPEEIFWSGHLRPGMPEDIRVISDVQSGAGPLGGISACFDVVQTDLLLVLAIDLPAMTVDFLQRLLAQCSDGKGIVAQHGDYFEPLAAIYPATLRSLAASHLDQKKYALHDFLQVALQQNVLRIWSLDPDEKAFFKNLNHPEDLASP